MKFSRIKLTNFMRYRGENTLNFSTDPEKNVTVILGDNTFGKTTIAQAFRWMLYGDVISTNYTNKKDIILLNNEVIANMTVNGHEKVAVEITVVDEDIEYIFTRTQTFRKKTPYPTDYTIIPIADSVLTMRTIENGKMSDIINDNGNNEGSARSKNFPAGCVRDTINNMFPEKLSNYFLFDGERWNDLKSKTTEIEASINTILGISSLLKMREHLVDGNAGNRTRTVIKLLRDRIKGSDSEITALQRQVDGAYDNITKYESIIEEKKESLSYAEEQERNLKRQLDDNRSTEEKQRELINLQNRLNSLKKQREEAYRITVEEFSKLDVWLAASFLPDIEKLMTQVDLEGRDIPGVTQETIDYLLEHGVCLCGEPITEGSDAQKALLRLREEVYPRKIGGPAKALAAKLEGYGESTEEFKESVFSKAQRFDDLDADTDDAEERFTEAQKNIDKKLNLTEIRRRYDAVEAEAKNLRRAIESNKFLIDEEKKKIEKLNSQIDELSKRMKENDTVNTAIAYVEEMYKYVCHQIQKVQDPTFEQLNTIIRENFEKMFDSKEKYAKLEKDYKIHMYYRSVGNGAQYEEENLSNGERIAINFVFIVSILELAKRRQAEMEENDEKTILRLPLVLDAPFSNLSGDNTGLVANKLPAFAEQVIIFMLDKDWEASGLNSFTKPEYCYRVNKEQMSNSSSFGLMGGEI